MVNVLIAWFAAVVLAGLIFDSANGHYAIVMLFRIVAAV